jgi:hypothetical protein
MSYSKENEEQINIQTMIAVIYMSEALNYSSEAHKVSLSHCFVVARGRSSSWQHTKQIYDIQEIKWHI